VTKNGVVVLGTGDDQRQSAAATITDSMNAALSRLGFPGHSVEACKQLVGEGIEHFAASALPSEQSRNEAMVARCIGLMREEYRKRWAAKTRPYDGIAELLGLIDAR